MAREDWYQDLFRTVEWDVCEERLAFSADNIAACLPQEIYAPVEHGVELSMPTLFGSSAAARSQTANSGAAWSDVQYVRTNYNLTGAGQTVAIIDSGIAYDHVALGGGLGVGQRVVGGWDFAENDANPYDDAPGGFHGTHIAGIVGANGTYTGVASGVDLVGLRVFDDQGNSSFAWVEKALQWVHDNRFKFANPITTVNLSIGYEGNDNAVPVWANLENELAQLKADGIFVAVAAGNYFKNYNQAGLTYPANSPHVVPVSSVTATGEFASSSQRNERVLAAPGQSITSTVPDFLRGADGVKNDWDTASGTSMASPYVAGSAALVRQALQRAGVTNITQDTIENQLRSTADTFYDVVTKASYQRVNLRRAIDAVLTNPANKTENITPNNANTNPAVPVKAERENWGVEDQRTQRNVAVAGEKWIDITAQNRGFFTIETESSVIGDVTLEMYRANGSRIAVSDHAGAAERIDLIVNAGETISVKLIGTNQNVALRYNNQVEIADTRVLVKGTSQNDAFEYRTVGNMHYIRVNDTQHEFNVTAIRELRFAGKEGNDTLRASGSAGNDTAYFENKGLSLRGSSYTVTGAGLEEIRVEGNGGNDTATMIDTAANDQFTGYKGKSFLIGGGVKYVALGFESVFARSVNGGQDFNALLDSVGDDRYLGYGATRRLEGTNYFVQTEKFSQTVVDLSLKAGKDTAYFYNLGSEDKLFAEGRAIFLDAKDRISAFGFEQATAFAKAGERPQAEILAVDYLFQREGF